MFRRALGEGGSHGAPLVLKSDNGFHFRAEAVARLRTEHITPLHSPPYTPISNGVCEAGVNELIGMTRGALQVVLWPGIVCR